MRTTTRDVKRWRNEGDSVFDLGVRSRSGDPPAESMNKLGLCGDYRSVAPVTAAALFSGGRSM